MKPQIKDCGEDAFHEWYSQQLKERWPKLVEACKESSGYFCLDQGLKKAYYLDYASVLAALSLEVSPGQKVLDLCAAPGGKSLILAQNLFGLCEALAPVDKRGHFVQAGEYQEETEESDGFPEASAWDSQSSETGLLICNERSPKRRSRLSRVLQERLADSCLKQIRIYGHDAALWGMHEEESYDRVLLDAPCSSERHLLEKPGYLQDWSPKRSKFLAQQSYAMLLSAARTVKQGGKILYSTCAFSDLENDLCVERVLKRLEKKGIYSLVPERPNETLIDFSLLEETAFGWKIWPDKTGGLGPIYFSLLKKTAPL